MRHRRVGKKLNRDTSHRRALYRNLITSLIVHGSVTTTKAKANAVKAQVDKLMTHAKKGALHNRRAVEAYLNKRAIVNQLVDEIAPATKKRASGFTRIVPLGRRRGDDAMMVRMELVDNVHSVDTTASPTTSAPKAVAKKPATKSKKPTEAKSVSKNASRPRANAPQKVSANKTGADLKAVTKGTRKKV